MNFNLEYRPEDYVLDDSDFPIMGSGGDGSSPFGSTSGGVLIETPDGCYVDPPLEENQRDIVYFYEHDWVHGGTWGQAIRATKSAESYRYDFLNSQDRMDSPSLHSSLPLTFGELIDFILSLKPPYPDSRGLSWIESRWDTGCQIVDYNILMAGEHSRDDPYGDYPTDYEEVASCMLEIDTPFYEELYDWIDVSRKEWLVKNGYSNKT